MADTGAVLPENTRLTKFYKGKKNNWFYLLIPSIGVFQKYHRSPQVSELKKELRQNIRGTTLPEGWREPFGHMWIPADKLKK